MKFVQDALDRIKAGTHTTRDMAVGRNTLKAITRNKTGPLGKFSGHEGLKKVANLRNPGGEISMLAGYDIEGPMVEQFFERVQLRSE